ncbi:yrdC domain-containing protein, mitochondrial-like isoform X2 [Limulus polyphemus]|uniref:Threonylcarbamoyl-AMP synthase n=1 Tax=Limulus polyphemus TaxID=6850 RepID=A0ABM1S372_LIMPO|nr:yrdC domain-containing protein, mitochondrial-like isoform X2 [Limulus polyphemus]
MNELLGWYGYEKLDSRETQGLNLQHFTAATSPRTSSTPDGSGSEDTSRDVSSNQGATRVLTPGTTNSETKESSPRVEDAVEQAVSFLQQGHVIAVPTDTIYGIACLAQNSTGVRKLYEIKKREQSKPIAICVADIQDIPLWGHVTVSTSVLQELLPGPVTLIFERTPNLNVQLNPTVKFVGIRIPNCSFIRCVAHSCGAPLALTSANMSSHSSTLAVEEFKDLWPDLGAVFDGGHLGENDPLRLGSTVVDLSVKGYYHIVRSGCAEETTKKILEKYHLMEC